MSKSLSLTEPSEKLYFVKRRTMKYEPEREPKLRKIKKVERKQKLPPVIKKQVQRLKYTQKGLTEVGEKRKQAREAREEPYSTPSVAELLKLEELKKKAIPPFEQQRLKKEGEAELKSKIQKAKEAGVGEDDKRVSLLKLKFLNSGFAGVPIEVLDKLEELEAADKDEFVYELLQATPQELKDEYRGVARGGSPPRHLPPPPPYAATEQAIADVLVDDIVSKNGLKLLRDFGLKGKQYRSSIKELDKLGSADLEYLKRQYEATPKPNPRFVDRMEQLIAQKQARGMGLKFKKGEVKRGRGRPKGSKNKPKGGSLEGAGLLSDIKALVKTGVKKAVEKVKENPLETAMKAFEVAKKAHGLYKGKQEQKEEARKERVKQHIKKTWDEYKPMSVEPHQETAGRLPLSKAIKRVGKVQSRLL